jgi:hypothetical protein
MMEEIPAASKVRLMRNTGDVLAGLSLGSLLWGGALIGAMTINSDNMMSMEIYAMVFGGTALAFSLTTGIAAIGLMASASSRERAMQPNIGPDDRTAQDDNADEPPFLKRPGSSLKIAGMTVAGTGLAAIIAGGVIKNQYNGISIITMGGGWIFGIIGGGLFGGSYLVDRNAAAASKYRLSIYMDPWTPKTSFLSAASAPDGAVMGIKGSF